MYINNEVIKNTSCRSGGFPTEKHRIYLTEAGGANFQPQRKRIIFDKGSDSESLLKSVYISPVSASDTGFFAKGIVKMKRVLGLILIAVMLIGLMTACGNTTAEQGNQPTPTSAPATENKSESAVTPETEDGNQEEATVTPVPVEKTDISVAVMKGPTALGMVKLMEDNEAGTTANNYSFTVAGTADEITPKLIKGELQIAAVPCNLASVLYNKTEGKISMLAVNTLGVLYIVETGDGIQKVEDLKGKTIFSTGKGTTPEYTLRYLLSAAGLDPDKDVTIEFKSEATEIAALLADADDAIAMLPQPYVTTVMMNNDKVRIALDVTAEWEALTNGESSVVTGVLVAQKSFIEENKEAVDAFLAEYVLSTQYANEQTESAAGKIR